MPKREILACFLKKPLEREKILRIMRITTLLILIVSIHLSVFANGQDKITVVLRNTVWSKALTAVEKASSYRFVYSSDVAPINKKIDLVVRDADLPEVMDKLLASTALSYKVMPDKLVVLFAKNEIAPEIRVSGRITDESGAPLAGASVKVKGGSGGVSANANGEYAITVPDDAVLIFSYVGYDEKQISVSGQATINVSLTPSAKVQDQVVVIGYGTASKRDLTGSIAKVSAKEIENKPAANPLNLLQGKVAGLSVVASGRVGSEPDVRIRGTNSINGVKPVYIVDGILNDNINFLNPADIESIEVLKDPSSLAIFGVRGANGAIAITTKKARAGQLIVNFNTSFGVKTVQDRIELTDGPQFKTMYDEQMKNMGSSFNDQYFKANTDWQDEIFQSAFLSYNNISISGATDKNKFYMGVGYIYEEGLIKHEEYKKYTLTINDELKVSKALKFGFTFSGYHAMLPVNKEVGSAIRAAPIAPVYDPNGSGLLHTLPAFQRAQVFNPLVSVETEKFTAISKEYRAVGSIYGELSFLKKFTFRTQFFADYGFNTSRRYEPILVVYNPEIVGNNKNDTSRRQTAVYQSQDIYPKTQMDYLLTYKNKFGDHDLTVLGGITTYYNAFEGVSSSVQQGSAAVIPNDPRFWFVDAVGTASTKVGSGSSYEEASLSYLLRGLYSFKKRYLLNASFRRDGSSQFYKIGNEWKNFGAVGAAWVVSQEDFFADLDFIDYLKIKGSWGVLGSKNIPSQYRYPAYPTLTNANAGVFGNNVINALQPQYIASDDLNWETVRSWEAGFELNTLDNDLHFEAAYYNRRTEDVITLIDLGAGQLPLLDNLGTIENKGFEFSATWNRSITRDLSFSVSGNLTTISNKVIQLNKQGFEIFNGPARTTAGYPIGYFYGYEHNGIYQTQTEILKSPTSTIGTVNPGDIKFKDVNGDGKIATDDRTFIGNPTPDFMYGGTISLTYKGFDLGIDLQGVYGNEIYRAWNQGTFADFNYLAERSGRWNGIGTSNWEPILHSGRANNYQNSSYWIEDGSFFRIRNLQLGYTFNQSFLSRAKIKSLRVYLNGQNVATFANSSGYTPEIGGSATGFGIDNGTYPVPAIYTFGLNLNF
jgi:TonB-linked SusC/RagA family outer membrane protein